MTATESPRTPAAPADAPPRIALTAGEPAGIGPDLCATIAQTAHPAQLVLIADPAPIAARAAALGLPLRLLPYRPEAPPRAQQAGSLEILPVPLGAPPVTPGQPRPEHARALLDSLARACDGCLRGEFDALVTGPLHKGVINDAGLAFSGHTEFLAARCQAEPLMLLAAPGLRVALATTHLPLRAVPDALTQTRLHQVLTTLDAGLRDQFGIAEPQILVCGLNPHAGEGGHLGEEEQTVIAPVLDRLRARGLRLVGPLPADTAFLPARLAESDAVLAMYHDQGLPVLKYLGFRRAVNVTLGLPILRTSVDHGTALELAGSGRADPASLEAALDMALGLIRRRVRTADPL